jgi:transposase
MSTDLFQGRKLRMPSDPEKLYDHVSHNYPDHEVSCAYEAGCCGFQAHRRFEGYGWKSLVVNPADVSRTGQTQYQKTDSLDADLLCRELKDGRLTGISVPDEKREQLRCLFRRRNELVKNMRKLKGRIKSQLLYLGVRIPATYDNPNWSKAFRRWLTELNFAHETAAATMRSRLEEYELLDKSIRDVSTQLRKYCKRDYKHDYMLLRSIPGIGGIVACGILSELGDLRRFGSFKQLAGYVGLMPSIYESGETNRSGGMNPRGHNLMRSYFIEASWQALRFDPVMQAYYRKHTGKDSKAILVKVAHKLLSRTLAVIKTETPYKTGLKTNLIHCAQ